MATLWTQAPLRYSMEFLRGLKRTALPSGPDIKEHLLRLGVWKWRCMPRGKKAGRHLQRKIYPIIGNRPHVCKCSPTISKSRHLQAHKCKSDDLSQPVSSQLGGIQSFLTRHCQHNVANRVLTRIDVASRNFDPQPPVKHHEPTHKNVHHLPSLFLSNARSLSNKLEEFELRLHDLHTGIAIVTETWFRENSPAEMTDIQGYTTFSRARAERSGGGVAVYVREDIPSRTLDIPVPEELECTWVNVRPHRLPRKVSCLAVCAVYSPPDSPHTYPTTPTRQAMAWITPAIKSMIQQRQQAFANNDKTSWKNLRNSVQRKISVSKSKYYNTNVETLKKEDPALWHKQIKTMTNSTRTEPVIHIDGLDPRDKRGTANAINKELASVINSLPPLDPAVLPSYLPSLQPPTTKPPSIKELRPISLTSLLSKVAENFICQWTLTDIIPRIDTQQFGGIKGRSTTHCLLDMTHTMFKACDKPNTICTLVSTDYSKEFDRVSHTVAICRLLDLGLRPSIARWITDFLTNRCQVVRYHGALSDSVPVTCGLPQGTLLGPLIFTAYINSAAQQVVSRRWKFVDDLNLLEVRDPPTSSSHLQQDLTDLDNWSKESHMMLHPGKCKVMYVYFSKALHIPRPLTINNVVLQEVSSMKILGIHLQANLKWNIHVDTIYHKASQRLYLLCKLKHFHLPIEDLVSVYISYIRPVMEYGAPVWHSGLSNSLSNKIEKVQRRALRIILGASFTSYSTACAQLGLPTLYARRHELTTKFAKSLEQSDQYRHLLPPLRGEVKSRTLDENRRIQVVIYIFRTHSRKFQVRHFQVCATRTLAVCRPAHGPDMNHSGVRAMYRPAHATPWLPEFWLPAFQRTRHTLKFTIFPINLRLESSLVPYLRRVACAGPYIPVHTTNYQVSGRVRRYHRPAHAVADISCTHPDTPGHAKFHGTCPDIDECLSDPNVCGAGTCRNKFGTYKCDCPDDDSRIVLEDSGVTVAIDGRSVELHWSYRLGSNLVVFEAWYHQRNGREEMIAFHPPTTIDVPPNLNATEGDQVTIQAHANGVPPPTYVWEKVNGSLPSNSVISATTGALKLLNATLQDSGEYRVTASNQLGNVSDVTILTILTADARPIPEPYRGRPG
ncbi:hypothetical protein Bbelb_141270 [Branchiostoma belcheri]|nr:hypothetical protein Bbelb_141270 [Branchiostoma belcheri]